MSTHTIQDKLVCMSFERMEQLQSLQKETLDESELRESFFLSYTNEALLDTFEEELEDVDDITDEELTAWRDALTELDENHLKAFLSMPYELRKRKLQALVAESRRADIVTVVKKEADLAFSKGFTVAYHCSPNENKPDIESGAWTIDGREQDHRDNDLGMAYYSFNLANLYRKKNPKYIYVVRADVGEDSAHRKDGDGAWGRAPKLDVIAKIDFNQSMEEVERRLSLYKKQQKNTRDE